MKPKNFKEQVWVGFGILVGSLVVFGALFYILVVDVQHAVDAIAQNRDVVASESTLVNSFSDLKENVASAAVYQTAMDKLLATQDNLIVFPSQIDGLAQKDDVDAVFSFEGDPVPSGPNTVGHVDFTLNATGPLTNITTFLKDMESSAPILLSKIDSFDLTQGGQSYTLAASGEVFFK